MMYSIYTNTVHITTRAYMHTVVLIVLWCVQNGQMIVPRGVPQRANLGDLGCPSACTGEARRTNGKWKQTKAVGSGCFCFVGED